MDTKTGSKINTRTRSNGKSYPVYMIHSKWSLSQLETFLKEYTDKVDYLRIVFDNLGKETNRTIVLLDTETYEKLCSNGYNKQKSETKGFNISQFTLKDNNLPGEGKSDNLFIPVPSSSSFTLTSDEIKTIVNKKLESFASWNIIEPNSWKLNIPMKSREKGDVKSGCFISFTTETPLESISLVRILLTDTYWNIKSEEKLIFRCFWARERKQLTDKFKKSEEVYQKVVILNKNKN